MDFFKRFECCLFSYFVSFFISLYIHMAGDPAQFYSKIFVFSSTEEFHYFIERGLGVGIRVVKKTVFLILFVFFTQKTCIFMLFFFVLFSFFAYVYGLELANTLTPLLEWEE